MSSIEIRRFIADSDDILNQFKRYFNASRHITEECILLVTEMEDPIETFQEAKAAINSNNIKMSRNEKQCVVFGSVSAGKSTTINAMINAKDVKKLPVGYGSVTNCFIEVRKSDKNKNYVIFPAEPRNERDLEELKRCDESNGHQFKTGSVVKLFYSGECRDLLNDNCIIVDTPGNNLDKSMDTHIQEICKESDILIFVVNSTTDFGYKEKEFLSRHKTHFSKFKLILLFNLWDKMNESRRARYLNKAKEYFCDQLNISETDDNEDIFFISSKERLQILSNGQGRKKGWEIRNNSFDQFLTFLKKRKIIIFRYLTVAGIALPATGLAVGAGIVGGIAVPLSTAVAAPIFATAGGITVGGSVGAASYAMTQIERFERFTYKPRYKDLENIVQGWYNCLKETLLNSYYTFENNLSDDVSTETPQLENQFNKMRRSINIFNERWNKRSNYINV